jgi:hypothetical protein
MYTHFVRIYTHIHMCTHGPCLHTRTHMHIHNRRFRVRRKHWNENVKIQILNFELFLQGAPIPDWTTAHLYAKQTEAEQRGRHTCFHVHACTQRRTCTFQFCSQHTRGAHSNNYSLFSYRSGIGWEEGHFLMLSDVASL